MQELELIIQIIIVGAFLSEHEIVLSNLFLST